MMIILTIARENILSKKYKYKFYYDFKVGDLVFLSVEQVSKGKSKKLSSLWDGPVEVVDVSKANCTILYKN